MKSNTDRLALIKSLVIKQKLLEMGKETKITPNLHSEAPGALKRHRGRPRKDVIADVLTASKDDYNFQKLSNDAGVIPVGKRDIEEELYLMRTYIEK